MRAFYLAILTALVWGVVPILEKIGLAKINPQTGLVFRCFGVMIGASMLVMMSPNILKGALSSGYRALLPFIIGGFLANFVGQLLFYSALKTGDVSRITPIAGSFPLVSFLLGIFLLNETITIQKGAGVALILFGLVLLR